MRQRLIKLGWAGALAMAAAGALGAGPSDVPAAGPQAGGVQGPVTGLRIQGRLIVQGNASVSPAAPIGQAPQTAVDLPSQRVVIPKAIEDLVSQLHSPVYATRDAATFALMRLDPSNEDAVRAAAEKETDCEAFTRLVEAAVHLHLRARTPLTGQQGVLGITLNIEPVRIGPRAEQTASVAVMGIEPGFPAEEVLKPGDRIVAVGGQTFPLDLDVVAFRERLNLTPPGSAVHFTIVRDGKLMKADVVLAGLSNDTVLANLVDERRNNAEMYVNNILASAAIERSSPALVLPDGTAVENRYEIRGEGIIFEPQPGPILIGPKEMIAPNSP
ncbi:MAG TPA: PDZ domain-containing protein [Phycisphaerae bacterium]|nr:PDZ domain-containing protein [Phycisphaerae bacterium]